MIRFTIFLAVIAFSLDLQQVDAQLLRGRIHQIRSCPVTACGLPGKYSYESRFVKRAASSVGYAVLATTSNAFATSSQSPSSRHVFRFNSPSLDIQSINGRISLYSLGGTLTDKGVFQFSGTLQHDGGRDQILRNPKLTISVSLMSSLSSQVTPPPNPVVVKTYQKDVRAEIVGNKIQLGGLWEDSDLAERFGEITHLRVQITHHPEL